ncbi:cytochrome b-c1 complex subunit 7 [Gymnogyps californianus]|uniref:cytochrome b-c1 complex subunit 7 n=1 Tax=Gymnogyps californianus TaxID=33616 RepID=UPI0021C92C13|nr:cytochrome b-c1 complex subunit 7 [Gymnogyps californianus]
MATQLRVTHKAARRREVNMAARAPVAGGGRLLDRIRKWYYNAAGFNKLGLMRDDTLYEDDDVKEALKRLPEHLYNERIFRIKRALDLSLKHQILPKDQWVKYEEDKCYLEPYLKEVIRERLEREAWNKK